MSESKQSVSGEKHVTTSDEVETKRNLFYRKGLSTSQQIRKSTDSGFIELTVIGEGVKTHDAISQNKMALAQEMGPRKDNITQSASDPKNDLQAEDYYSDTQVDGLAWTGRPLSDQALGTWSDMGGGRSEHLVSDAETSMASTCSVEHDEVNTEGEEEAIIGEGEEIPSCLPKPIPHFRVIRPPNSEHVMLKWPLSNGRFLRAIHDTDKPIIIIDFYRKKFKDQYCFTAETKCAVDARGVCYFLMCFRYDLCDKPFYLTPKTTAGVCPPTLLFNFAQASREDVVVAKLSNDNSQFWYTYKSNPFPILESLAFPRYFLSLEKGTRAVLRETDEPDTRNFHIQIIEQEERNCNNRNVNDSIFSRLSRGIKFLSCSK